MSQPPPYNRLANFTNYALAHPSAPYNPSDHDAELNAVETTVDALCTNIALIQRDDGELANETVGIDQIETEIRALIAIGENAKVEPWTTGHTYNPGDAVSFGTDAYLCVVQHVAGTFALDLAAGYWVLIGIEAISATLNAALVSFAPTGTIASTNVQAAVAEVAAEAIQLTEKGAPGGVPVLDGSGQIPPGQLPDLSGTYLTPGDAAATYIPLTEKGAPGGVATLDVTGMVEPSQLPPTGGPFIPLGQKGIANGVAELDAATLVPVAQLPPVYVPQTAPTGAAVIPAGTTGQRPGAPAVGYVRWNATLGYLETWNGTFWTALRTGNDAATGNRIINGNFAIDQRFAGAAVSITTGSVYAVDRWFGSAPAAAGAFQLFQAPLAAPPGEFALGIGIVTPDAALAATDAYLVGQRIEGHHVADLNFGSSSAEAFTFAFTIGSTVAGTMPVSFKNATRSYVTTINVPVGTQSYVMTIPGDTAGVWEKTNGQGMQIAFGLGAGTTFNAPAADSWQAGSFISVAGCTNFMASGGQSLSIANVRLYRGLTDYGAERRLYAQELALCQRYFERIAPAAGGLFGFGMAETTTNGKALLQYALKRAAPTITANSIPSFTWAGNQLTALTLLPATSERVAVLNCTHAGVSSVGFAATLVNNGGPASIDISAEL